MIDAHVHVWTPDTKQYPLATGFTKADMMPASFTPDELMAHAKPVGVGRVVLIQMSFYGNDNSYMLETMRRYKGVYSGVAVIDENDEPVSRMKELAKQGVKGFRIRPGQKTPDEWLSAEGMQKMWRCGADEGLAMCHLINPEYLPAVDKMCRKFPQTPVVIDHFARIGIDGKVQATDLDNLCRLARFDNVTVKVSAYYALGRKVAPYSDLGPMVRRLRDAFGAERLMWASDCPYQVQEDHTYKASIDLIKGGLSFLSRSDKDWILKKTAERVFFA
ncbi:MAG: amidohydrolase family protein [Planctomycetales bacterium]|nr:amidohydrolase family protein [Planctomycetales bacterium]